MNNMKMPFEIFPPLINLLQLRHQGYLKYYYIRITTPKDK